MPRDPFPVPKIFTSETASQRSGLYPGNGYQSTLEKDFPRILETIQAMWGNNELNMYFRKLTMDERDTREGFPPEVWNEIHLLLSLHQEIVPEPLL